MGFINRLLRLYEDIDFAYVTFMGQNLAIEFVLDEREKWTLRARSLAWLWG
jgi:hypothetical protein